MDTEAPIPPPKEGPAVPAPTVVAPVDEPMTEPVPVPVAATVTLAPAEKEVERGILQQQLSTEEKNDASHRRKELTALRIFESKRNAFFVDQYQQNMLYWKSLGDLVKENESSTNTVLTFLERKVESERSHASRLYANFDFVSGDKKGACNTRCDKERASKAKGQALPTGASSKHGSSMGEIKVPNGTIKAAMEVAEVDCGVAKALDDLCDAIEKDHLHGALRSMAKDTHTRFNEYLSEGDACLRTLQNIDHHTHNAYSEVQEVAGEKLQLEKDNHQKDVWLLDMQYRVAVRQQNEAWKTVMVALQGLFQKMKELEVLRRTELKKALKDIVDKTEAMWLTLPPLRAPVLPALEAMDADSAGVARDVDEKTREGVEKMKELQKKTFQQGDIPKDETFITELEEPMVSPLIRLVMMMERKESGVVSSKYLMGLLVLTWDGWLHFFDLPKASKLTLDTPPMVVFRELAPIIDVSHFKLNKRGEEKIEVHTAFSLELVTDSSVEILHGKKSHKFEVTGLMKKSSFKAALGSSHGTKSVTLRCSSESLMMDVAVKIRAACEGAGETEEESIRENFFSKKK